MKADRERTCWACRAYPTCAILRGAGSNPSTEPTLQASRPWGLEHLLARSCPNYERRKP